MGFNGARRGHAVALTASAILLLLLAAGTPRAAAAVEVVQASLVGTTQTSQFTPPSPDPSGITYDSVRDRLVVVDSEVEEMTIYQGANIFVVSRGGALLDKGTTVPLAKEPTGVGIKASDNTLFVSDDDRDRVYIIKPGTDGRHGTVDDVVTSFSTTAFGSGDSEGIEYDPVSGHLFVIDGTGLEVYDVDPVNGVFADGNDVVTHFDMAQYGARNCEGIGYDPQRDALLVIDDYNRKIYEVTKSGDLSRIIDLSALGTPDPELYAEVTMAPSSDPTDSPTKLNYWIVDRQVDNGADPNENDGKLYEVSVPSTDASPTVSVTSPASGASVSGTISLTASASDDVGVAQVAFAVDGVPVGTDTDGGNGWSVSFNTASASNGPHTVAATATDTGGQTASDSHGFTVSNDGSPTVSVTSPASGASVSGTISLTASASDDVGVAQVAFAVDGVPVGTDTDGGNGWSVSFNTASASNGPHTVAATATDTGGQTASDSHGFTVSNDGSPTVSVTSPASGASVSGTISLTASASDDVGVAQVAFAVDGVPVGTDTDGGNGWSVSFNTASASNGPHTVAATATDTGGQTASDSHGFTVSNNNAQPVVSVTAPANGASFFVGDTITFTGTATDAEDGNLTSTLAWTSSIDGTIGAGGTFSRTLSQGTHTITASTVDSHQQTGSGSVTITVSPRPPTSTTSRVVSISYALDGGKNQNSHITVTVTVVNNLGNPVSGATLSVRVNRNGTLYKTVTGTTGTNGVLTFKLSNAPTGCYASTVNSVTATGLTWDGVTPSNTFCKT